MILLQTVICITEVKASSVYY